MSCPDDSQSAEQNYDEMSVLWTRGKNKGGDEKCENAKSVGQMMNKRRKRNETRSVSQCGERMVQDEGMWSKQGKGRRRAEVASPRDPDTLLGLSQGSRAKDDG